MSSCLQGILLSCCTSPRRMESFPYVVGSSRNTSIEQQTAQLFDCIRVQDIEMGDVPVVMHDIQKFTHVIYRDKISRKSDSTWIKKNLRTIYYKFRTLSEIQDISGQIIKNQEYQKNQDRAHPCWTTQMSVYYFLLVNNNNLHLISHCLQVIIQYWSLRFQQTVTLFNTLGSQWSLQKSP